MTTQEFLDEMAAGNRVVCSSPTHQKMGELSQDALRITMQLNNAYHTPEEIVGIFSRLTGKAVDENFRLFPPFTTDCGKNISLGKNVFINSGCRFQDHGGITIEDGALIGHNVVIATLTHDLSPATRGDLFPAPVHIGRNAWIGAGATILPGVTIGNNVVIGAGAVVSRDIPDNSVAVGVPARVVKTIENDCE